MRSGCSLGARQVGPGTSSYLAGTGGTKGMGGGRTTGGGRRRDIGIVRSG